MVDRSYPQAHVIIGVSGGLTATRVMPIASPNCGEIAQFRTSLLQISFYETWETRGTPYKTAFGRTGMEKFSCSPTNSSLLAMPV